MGKFTKGLKAFGSGFKEGIKQDKKKILILKLKILNKNYKVRKLTIFCICYYQ